MSIVARDLTFVYNKKTKFASVALKNLAVEIKNGEFVAIVGHTGSGKSTFVQHLNALIRVQDGYLSVGDHVVSSKNVDLKKLRSSVGMVFQYPENQLFADTVYQDVAFGPQNSKIPSEEIETKVKNAISLVGLDYESVKNKSPFELSGGEKRRVALAGILVMDPDILVLDEPTAGLDPVGKREILSLVKTFATQKNKTVIMVSHDMNEVYENADRVLVMKDGTIVYDLPPKELFKLEKEIIQMKLEVPYVAQFLNVLEKKGFVFDKTVKTIDQVVSKLKFLIRKC